jgi:hypothetical protein
VGNKLKRDYSVINNDESKDRQDDNQSKLERKQAADFDETKVLTDSWTPKGRRSDLDGIRSIGLPKADYLTFVRTRDGNISMRAPTSPEVQVLDCRTAGKRVL